MKINRLHQRRLWIILAFALGLALALGLILYALQQNINVFLTPSQLTAAEMQPDYRFRLGGLVKEKSVVREQNNLGVHFIVTDLKSELPVYYVGVLPDLFREGKGVIAVGGMNANGVFVANEVLAKHDENYMPKNVYQTLRKNAGTTP